MQMAEHSGGAAAAIDEQTVNSYFYLNRDNKNKAKKFIDELEADQRGIRDMEYFRLGTLFPK